jgi:hypothetical protein
MPDDGTNGKILNDILIHVGETRKGIANLETNVEQIKDHLAVLNHSTVKKSDCRHRHESVRVNVDGLQQDLSEVKGGVKTLLHSDTGQELAAVTPEMLSASGSQVAIPEDDTNKGMRGWLVIAVGIGAILTLLGGVALGLMKVGRHWERLDQSFQDMQERQKQTTKKLQQAAQRVNRTVYIKVPMAPSDAGVRPRPKPKRRPKRLRRRP